MTDIKRLPGTNFVPGLLKNMKHLNSFFTVVVQLVLTASLFSSCEKGEDIPGVGYGKLQLNSSFSGDASALLIQVDGETKDTLTSTKPATTGDGIVLKTGKHRVLLVNQETKKVLSDTTVSIETARVFNLPKFFYSGTAALFDDLNAKPQKDSILIRLVTTDPALPEVMDITISLYDYDQINVPLVNKKIRGVRKDRFSEFVQLPDPYSLAPNASFILYAIEATDPNDNNKKVMDIAEATNSYLEFEGPSYYTPNGVLSMGIGPFEGGVHLPVRIFNRIAE